MARMSVRCYKLQKESINKVKFDVNFLEEGTYAFIRYIFMHFYLFHENCSFQNIGKLIVLEFNNKVGKMEYTATEIRLHTVT